MLKWGGTLLTVKQHSNNNVKTIKNPLRLNDKNYKELSAEYWKIKDESGNLIK